VVFDVDFDDVLFEVELLFSPSGFEPDLESFESVAFIIEIFFNDYNSKLNCK